MGNVTAKRRACPVLRSILLLAALVVPHSAAAETGSQLKLGGTGGDLGTMRKLGAVFMARHSDVMIEVLPSLGSGGGIRAVMAGAVDIALTSRPLKDDELRTGARVIPYARTPFVFATPAGNPQGGVTTEDLVAFFSGRRTAWADGSMVRVVLRPDSDNDHKILLRHLPVLEKALREAAKRPGVPIAYSDQEAADYIERLHWGVGTSSLSIILGEDRGLKALALDGVAATPENLAKGAYKMEKTYYLVTAAAPGELAREFIAFVFSEQGRAILRRTGHLVLDDGGGG
jgi:phosphate transport system substrate-binding protein